MVRTEHLAILGALLAVACASDVAARRVPNALVIAIAAAGVAAHWASGGVARALGGALAGALVLAVLLAGWAAGGLGGGDVKLAAATAVWIGPSGLVAFVLFTAMAAVPVALAGRAARRLALWRVARAVAGTLLPERAPARETVPLAVAIALGAGAVLSWSMP
jgi:Flp pilus assembly protein protease CpaA